MLSACHNHHEDIATFPAFVRRVVISARDFWFNKAIVADEVERDSVPTP